MSDLDSSQHINTNSCIGSRLEELTIEDYPRKKSWSGK